jgi:hypothetical protein
MLIVLVLLVLLVVLIVLVLLAPSDLGCTAYAFLPYRCPDPCRRYT